MPSALSWLVVAAVLLVPPAAVLGLVLWARRLRGAGRFAVWTAYGVAAIAALVIIVGLVVGFFRAATAVHAQDVEPSRKARALAVGISEAMNCGAFALLIVAVGGAGVAGWRWWWLAMTRSRARPTLRRSLKKPILGTLRA